MLAVFIFFSSSFTAESLENENVQAETFCSFYDFLYQSAAQDLVNVFLIVIRNWKIVWKHGPYCWYFRLNLKYLAWPYREYIKAARNCGFWEELLTENDFEAVLVTFCCRDHGGNASEAVQKIATDQVYHKCSACVIVCWMTKIHHSITVKKVWLLGHLPRS